MARVFQQLAIDTRNARIETQGLVDAQRQLVLGGANAPRVSGGGSAGGGSGSGGGSIDRVGSESVALLRSIDGRLRDNPAAAFLRGFGS